MQRQRLNRIRAGFINQDTSLHAWCCANNIDTSNARKALSGKWSGPKAQALIEKLETAAGGTE